MRNVIRSIVLVVLSFLTLNAYAVNEEVRKLYYETGTLKYETPFINGKINGIEKRYYESGKLKSRIKLPRVWYERKEVGRKVRFSIP
jgi:hypothetical protein